MSTLAVRTPSTGKRSYPEQRLQIQVRDHLLLVLKPPADFWATPNGGLLPAKRDGDLRKAMGVKAGIPDLCVIWPGNFAGIELKAPRPAKVQTSDEQILWGQRFHACGHHWAICRSLAEVDTFLRLLGAPLRSQPLRSAA